MQLSNAPGKLLLPFVNAGAKNSIPVASQIGITAGAASLTDGFPPLTRTPIAAGGVPPSGLDMNGILYALSAALRWANAGGGYVYDSTFANDSNVTGYPKGARVLRSDGAGYWLNTIDGNTVDPESVTVNAAQVAGWVPDLTNGVAAVTMTSANVTLTPMQYGKPIIVLSGTLTANLNLIFPNLSGEWTVVNNCTGAFTVTAKTAAGTGIAVASGGKIRIVWGDGANIYSALNAGDTAAQFDNSTLFATTEFVQKTGVHFPAGSGTGLVTSQTLGLALSGCWLEVQAAGLTITLPTLASAPAGLITYTFKAVHGFTLKGNGTELIGAGSASGANTVAILPGETLTVVSTGAGGSWYVVFDGFGANSFVAARSSTGYQKLPGGLILQWDSANVSANAILTVNFPIAFPTACFGVFVTSQQADMTNTATPGCAGEPISTTQAKIQNTYSASGILMKYLAIGN